MGKSLADTLQLFQQNADIKASAYLPESFLRNDFCLSALINALYELNTNTFELARWRVDVDTAWVPPCVA